MRDLVDYKLVLLDAFGVLYNANGILPGVAKRIQELRAKNIAISVITNNTSLNPISISRHLASLDIPISHDAILSSGHGLAKDLAFRSLIQNKAVFVLGSGDSQWYITHAGGHCVGTLAESEAIVLAMSTPHRRIYDDILHYHRAHPDVPIICINPDKRVQTGSKQDPVIGQFATALEGRLSKPIQWMGKPYPAFSAVVAAHCHTCYPNINRSDWVFVDDNPDNVVQISQDLGIDGRIPYTGLASTWPQPIPVSDRIQRLPEWGQYVL